MPDPLVPTGASDAGKLEWLKSAQFSVVRRGYNVDQVDRFIEEIVPRSRQLTFSPSEIRDRTFSKAFRGYKVSDVDGALERAAKQFEIGLN